MNDTTHLRFLQSFTLGPVPIKANPYVFFGTRTNVAGGETEKTEVDLYEMTKNGICKDLFGSLGGDLRSFSLSEDQIIEFFRTQHDHLRSDGIETFFLVEMKGRLFVAHVSVDGDSLGAYVLHIDDNHVYSADSQLRLIVRRQTS